MNVTAIKEKAGKPKSANVNLPVSVGQDADGNIVITIPQRFREDVVHPSNTEKAVPMVTLVPKYADGRSGNVTMPIVITSQAYDGDGNIIPDEENEHVFGLRIGAFNGFVTA